jgi:MerR family copper efflux transcriptional regulator
MQIGEAADRVGLSIRTIRHYEEAGLVVPSARSDGGFRLCTEPDLDRLRVVKRMKPLGFTLDEMRDLLAILDELTTGSGDRTALLERLLEYHQAAEARVETLRTQRPPRGSPGRCTTTSRNTGDDTDVPVVRQLPRQAFHDRAGSSRRAQTTRDGPAHSRRRAPRARPLEQAAAGGPPLRAVVRSGVEVAAVEPERANGHQEQPGGEQDPGVGPLGADEGTPAGRRPDPPPRRRPGR